MRWVYGLFRLPRQGGAELLGIYSSHARAQKLIDSRPEPLRRFFRIEPYLLNDPLGEEFWLDPHPYLAPAGMSSKEAARRLAMAVEQSAPKGRPLFHWLNRRKRK